MPFAAAFAGRQKDLHKKEAFGFLDMISPDRFPLDEAFTFWLGSVSVR